MAGCEDDDDCSSNEACRNQDCVNPCVIPRNPCSNPATCSVNNHQPICTCPPGYEENAYGQCTPGRNFQTKYYVICVCKEVISTGVKPNSIYFFIVKKGECDHDTDCSDDKACIEHSCRDPCKLGDLCGQDAICETSAHRPVCRCPEGWGGVPTTQCFQCKKSI